MSIHSIHAARACALALLLAATGAASAAPVYADATGGDAFTNAGTSNQGQAIGASDWYYNNVRSGGQAGIGTQYPREGNGAATLAGPANAKADIEYLPNAVNVGGNFTGTTSLGTFSSLSALSYDWYRSSASTAASHLHPALRVLLDLDGNLATTGDRGGLVYEFVYNGGAVGTAVATDQWVSTAVTGTTKLWNFGLGIGTAANINGTPYPYDATLAEWQRYAPDAAIIGFSAGIGSGWGPFSGAVDNIAWTIRGEPATSNFEVRAAENAVPEPGSAALAIAALLGAAATVRRMRPTSRA